MEASRAPTTSEIDRRENNVEKSLHPAMALADRIRGFGGLEDDWDSYGAPPIDKAAIERALKVVAAAESGGIPAPYAFPTTRGGVSLEWCDAEVEIAASGELTRDTANQARVLDEFDGVYLDYRRLGPWRAIREATRAHNARPDIFVMRAQGHDRLYRAWSLPRRRAT